MQQGIQIPIQTVANNTVTVTFKDAVLTLQVTPQITAAGTVIMQVSVENMTADFSRQVNGIPPIDTQERRRRCRSTTARRPSSAASSSAANSRRPTGRRCCTGFRCSAGCSGATRCQDESRELLIFITPRILKG